MFETLKSVTILGSALSEAVATAIIVYAVLEVFVRTVVHIGTSLDTPRSAIRGVNQKEAIRLRLGTWLALGLEVLIAADILRSVVAPSWNDIAQLAVIIVLRVVLNYFLQRDIDTASQRETTLPGD